MNILSIVIAIISFCFLIVIHEFGHFIAARIFGVKVDEFAIGMGPKLFSHKGKNTLFTVRAIPVGGFCAMQGESTNDNPGREENPEAENINPDESLINKKPWQRFIILAAGPVMNLLFGLIFCLCVYSFASGSIVTTTVESGTVLKPNDQIVQVDDWRVYTPIDLNMAINFADEETTFKVKRDGKTEIITVSNTETFETKKVDKTIGTVLSNSGRLFCSLSQNIFKSLQYLLQGEVTAKDMSGPVGVVSVMADSAEIAIEKKDASNIFSIIALISVNLGIFNLLPVPLLDGGHILFLLIEKIRKKPIPEKVENGITFAFMIVLFGFMIYISIQDVLRLFV